MWYSSVMASNPEPVRAAEAHSHALDGNVDRAETLARLVIREGKQFKASALEAGYSRAVAVQGLKSLMAQSAVVTTAIRAEWDKINIGLEKLNPFAVRRLYSEIVDPNSANGMRAIELAGRFKETDWFVRNADVNLGVFLNMAEQATPTDDTPEFKE